MTSVLARIVVVLFIVSSSASGEDPTAGAWARFDAARLGVSFEHPVSMQGVGFSGCGTGLLNEKGKAPERVPPQQIFHRASGTDGNTGNATQPGRQLQLAVWLGDADDSWWMPAFESVFAGMLSARFGQGLEQQPRADESLGAVDGGGTVLRRIAGDRHSVVYRVAEAAGRVIYIRGQIRVDLRLESMTEAEITAFDRVARSVAFADRKEPKTEPCGEWTRWHGAGWSVCVPSGWKETAGSYEGDPSQGTGPIPPVSLAFAESEQRFSLLMPLLDGRAANPVSQLMPVASVGARGPYPTESEGEPMVAGTWAHAARWIREYEPPEGGGVQWRVLQNEGGQDGFFRVIEHPSLMRPDAGVGPLGRPEKSVHYSYSLYAPDRVEYRLVMTAWYELESAHEIFEKIARAFVLEGTAVQMPADFRSKP